MDGMQPKGEKETNRKKKDTKRRSCLHQGVNINSPEIGDVAHLLPVVGHVVGGNKDELRCGEDV